MQQDTSGVELDIGMNMRSQSRTRRALIVEAAPSFGGSMTSIELVIRHGRKERIEFALMSQFQSDLFDGKVQTFQMPPERSIRHGLKMAEELLRTRQAIQSFGADVVILNNMLTANYLSLLAAKSLGKPVIQMVRAYERPGKSWQWLHRQVDAFVAVSESVRQRLLGIGAKADKVHLAYEGIAAQPLPTLQAREEGREACGLPLDGQVIGFIGRLVPWKGYKLYIEAAIQAALLFPKLHAVMIGGAPESEQAALDALKKKVEEAGLCERIHFLGERSHCETMTLLKGWDLLLHTSTEPEPFGRVLLEAMALGIPVLSSSEGGPREFIKHRQNGILARPGDLDSIVEEIAWLLMEQSRRIELGMSGYKTIVKDFNEAVCATPVLDLIRQLAPAARLSHATAGH